MVEGLAVDSGMSGGNGGRNGYFRWNARVKRWKGRARARAEAIKGGRFGYFSAVADLRWKA